VAPELDVRLLRYFVAVAEELHFTRAASRLFVAQQALSRDIQRLEERAGVPLLERTTRRVTLTPAGEQLLVRARELLALHDQTLRELQGLTNRIVVDVVGHGLTPETVLAAARRRGPDVEYFAEFHGGLELALPLLQARRLDVTFGRLAGVTAATDDGFAQRLIRLERIAVLLPEQHRLAALRAVPLAALRDHGVCWRAGTHVSTEWEQAILQLLTGFDADVATNHPRVRDLDELTRHLHYRKAKILVLSSQPAVPGGVLRPLVEPVAAYPWSMIWRRDLNHPGLRALHSAVDDLAAAEHWLDVPPGTWLPEPEATRLGAG
jgi:DNA-binding transcriptional LysR family regulator